MLLTCWWTMMTQSLTCCFAQWIGVCAHSVMANRYGYTKYLQNHLRDPGKANSHEYMIKIPGKQTILVASYHRCVVNIVSDTEETSMISL